MRNFCQKSVKLKQLFTKKLRFQNGAKPLRRTKTESRKKETLYHSRIQFSFSYFFSAQLIFAEVLGSELMLLRSFFPYFLGAVSARSVLSSPRFGSTGWFYQGFSTSDSKRCKGGLLLVIFSRVSSDQVLFSPRFSIMD